MKNKFKVILIVFFLFCVYQVSILSDMFFNQNKLIELNTKGGYLIGNLYIKKIVFVKDNGVYKLSNISQDALDGYNRKYLGDHELFTVEQTYPYFIDLCLIYKIEKIIHYKVLKINSKYYFSYYLKDDIQ